MTEYIDRTAIREFPIRRNHYDKEHGDEHFINGIETVMEYIDEIPAADVAPVVHGKWLNDFCGKGRFSKRIVQCSLCRNFLDLDGVNAGRGDANFCPNCGAKMDGEICTKN